NGLLRLDYAKISSHAERNMPRITVTDLLTNGNSVMSRVGVSSDDSEMLTITLSESETDIEVLLSTFAYINPKYQSIEYMLEGYDQGWRMINGASRLHYYDLPSGTYVLHLRIPGVPQSETRLKVHRLSNLNVIIMLSVLLVLAGVVVAQWIRHQRERRRQQSLDVRGAEAGTDRDDEQKKVRYKTTRLTDEECKLLLKVLEGVMREHRPYTNPDLKSAELAAMAGTTGHALSYLFNQYLNKSYYDYVNEYRVDEFKRLVGNLDISKYTLTAMSQMCGFSSRASFFRRFKAVTGITPAEYLKAHK
ncbi:MAG: helix-turn-helix domain-containing protein, partial [Muribaculaceae bacterium]|nr:helix-turn-helix domain-containing protein [Muribaculaceae bacterium]